MTWMAPNDLKWLLMIMYVFEGSIEVIWDHLESFKSWGDKGLIKHIGRAAILNNPK